MNELDDKIQQLLDQAAETSRSLDDPSLTDEILDTFKGRDRALMIATVVKMVAAGLLFYFCVWQFFQQDALMPMLAYATAAIICVLTAATTMLFLWIQKSHNTTRRELKRLELQYALIADALRSSQKV